MELSKSALRAHTMSEKYRPLCRELLLAAGSRHSKTDMTNAPSAGANEYGNTPICFSDAVLDIDERRAICGVEVGQE
jgi:hypothetical protein